ncbi:DNA ligase (ATP) [Gaertneriomyces sp. JEL0708]|nr:DNA ligase (ATP) [Gaertneriomyces sp. JEL0708]
MSASPEPEHEHDREHDHEHRPSHHTHRTHHTHHSHDETRHPHAQLDPNVPPLPDRSHAALFYDLVKCYEGVSTKNGRDAKKERLRRFVESWRQTGGSFFPFLRLILPHLDKARTTYGMKTTVLAKTYITVIGLSPASPDALALIHYRDPKKASAAGDFPTVLRSVLEKRSTVQQPTMTVGKLNELLDWLNATSDKVEREEIFREIFQKCTVLEQLWISRIILKDLKLGISENGILGLFHPDALELFNVTSDLSVVCDKLRDPRVRLEQKEIRLWRTFVPMLSRSVMKKDSLGLEEVVKGMNGHAYWVETKLDGERLQCHYEKLGKGKAAFRWYSRRGTDYTDLYGSDQSSGALSQYIMECFSERVNNAILDGEMLAYNVSDDTYEPFGTLKSACNETLRLGAASKLRPVFVMFDIVYLNGHSLCEIPLYERRSTLEKALRPKLNYLELLEHQEGRTVNDVISLLDQRMHHNEEGIIIKDPNGRYHPTKKRESSSWFKLKPDYISHLAENVDVLLLGAYYGEGRRGGILSQFLCCVKGEKRGDIQEWISFVRIGTGYKIKELEDVSGQSTLPWRPYDPRHPPPFFKHLMNSKDKPDMILAPQFAKVIEVKGAEIVPSDTYAAGWTVRFPRFVRVREDKGLEGVMSLDELREIVKKGAGMQSRIGGLDMSKKRKERKETRMKEVVGVATDFRGWRGRVERLSGIFDGWEICVLPGAGSSATDVTSTASTTRDEKEIQGGYRDEDSDEDELRTTPGPKQQVASKQLPSHVAKTYSKPTLEQLLLSHHATITQNPSPATTFIVADEHTLRLTNLMKAGRWDIVKSAYILECVRQNRVVEAERKWCIFATDRMKKRWKDWGDRWGDSWRADVRVSGLKEIFSTIPPPKKAKFDLDPYALPSDSMSPYSVSFYPPTNRTIQATEQKYFGMMQHAANLFRPFILYLDVFKTIHVVKGTKMPEMDGMSGLYVRPVDHVAGDNDETGMYRDDWLVDSALRILSPMIRSRGGIVQPYISSDTTHIILDSAEVMLDSRMETIQALAITDDGKRAVVSDGWIRESIDCGRVVPEENWMLKRRTKGGWALPKRRS